MKLTHYGEDGRIRMVDIASKKVVVRKAVAEGRLSISPKTAELIKDSELPKGNPLEIARIAGIQAAKRTADLIPLCHTINLDWIDLEIRLEDSAFLIRSTVSCCWSTGVEMEALTAVSVAALTLYDMCKAVDKEMSIGEIRLVSKEKR